MNTLHNTKVLSQRYARAFAHVQHELAWDRFSSGLMFLMEGRFALFRETWRELHFYTDEALTALEVASQLKVTRLWCGLPFGNITVKPDQIGYNPAEAIASPQVPFKGHFLLITKGHQALIQELRIGNHSMLITSDPLPAAAYSVPTWDENTRTEAFDRNRIDMPVALVGHQLALRLENPTKESFEFEGLVVGQTIDEYRR